MGFIPEHGRYWAAPSRFARFVEFFEYLGALEAQLLRMPHFDDMSEWMRKLSLVQPSLILGLTIASTACSPCWGRCGGKPLAEARAEFHRRWNAKQFHEIYANSETRKRGHEADYIANWERAWPIVGTFQEDKDEVDFDNLDQRLDDAILVTRYYNCVYNKAPVLEHYQWSLKDNYAILIHFDLHPNVVMRCERSLFGQACADYDRDGTNITAMSRGRPIARCRDKTYVMAPEKQGLCYSHGGVAERLGDSPMDRSANALKAFMLFCLLVPLAWVVKQLRT